MGNVNENDREKLIQGLMASLAVTKEDLRVALEENAWYRSCLSEVERLGASAEIGGSCSRCHPRAFDLWNKAMNGPRPKPLHEVVTRG